MADSANTARQPATTSAQRPTEAVWPVRLVWAGLGAAAVLGALQLPIGTLNQPGAGLWPLIIGTLILVSAFFIRTPRGGEPRHETFSYHPGRLAIAVGSIAVFIALFATIGFLIPVFLFLFVWLTALAGRSWWASAITAAVGTVLLFLGLVLGLNAPLPDDVIVRLIG